MTDFFHNSFIWCSNHQFLFGSILLWIVICLPINLISLWFGQSSPTYTHLPPNCFCNDTSSISCCPLGANIQTIDNESQSLSFNGKSSIANDTFGLILCYDYVVDVEELLDKVEFWISGVCLSTVGGIGIIGNLMTLWVLSRGEEQSRRKNSFNRLLVYLAMVDTFLIILCVTEYSILDIFVGEPPHWYLKAFPHFLHPVKHNLLSMCIFMVVAISLERCQAICHPLRSRPSPFAYLATVLAISIGLNFRKFFELRMSDDGNYYETTSLMEYAPYLVFSNVWQELIMTGVLPIFALLFYNFRIYGKIRASTRHECHRYVIRSSVRNCKSSVRLMRSPRNQAKSEELDESRKKSFASFSFRKNSSAFVTRDSNGPRFRTTSKSIEVTFQEDPEIQGFDTIVTTPFSKLNTGLDKQTRVTLLAGQKKMRKQHEKTVAILIMIVLVFLLCHSFRLGIQTFQTLHYQQSLRDHFDFCQKQNRLSYPATFLILISFNNLFIVFSSSVNFIIYCFIRKLFRKCILVFVKKVFCY